MGGRRGIERIGIWKRGRDFEDRDREGGEE